MTDTTVRALRWLLLYEDHCTDSQDAQEAADAPQALESAEGAKRCLADAIAVLQERHMALAEREIPLLLELARSEAEIAPGSQI